MNAATSLQCLILSILMVGNQGRIKEITEKRTDRYGEECRQERNIPIGKYEKMKLYDLATTNDPDMQDLIFCMTTKFGIMDKDGNFLVDDMLADITKKKTLPWTKDQVVRCSVQKDTPGDSAQAFFVCLNRIDETDKLMDECVNELGLDQYENLDKEPTQSEIHEKVGEITFCVLKKWKVMDSEGNFLMNNMKEIFQDAVNAENFKRCVVKRGTPEETAYAFLDCLNH